MLERKEPGSLVGEENDAGLSVTQSDDPLSGGHFSLGVSKPPPRSAREGSRVIVYVVSALNIAHGENVVKERCPISNGLTAVGGAKTRFLIRYT